ncbi:MAG: proline dehydrogenase family protein [Bacteroidales bacterium]|nr:proline dehydrogenase family protein [Bacteroidales bacterium]MCF8454845.1 proline dehydrogenase family protein [Bacteroidales bacterium]
MDFNNTEIAFRSKSDKDLAWAYFLFRILANTKLVIFANKLLGLALSLKIPIGWIVKPTVYKHFVGGETIDGCQKSVRLLEKYKVKAILDFSVEGKESIEDIEHAVKETLQSIKNAASDPNVPFAVFKPTAFTRADILEKVSAGAKLSAADKIEADNFRKRVNTLCQAAYDANIPILIDAEDSWFQKFIDDVVTENQMQFNKEKAIVYNTLQMYRWDRLDFLKQSYEHAKANNYFYGVKFVRGAYMEKERERAKEKGYKSPIQPDKESTDRDYNAALKYCMEHIDRISIFNGTHNEYSSQYLADLMAEQGLEKNDSRIYFAQLFGMSDHISFNLGNEGYNVAKYLPYGPVQHVMPYLFRRAEENTSVAGQTGRELSLILKERERRKGKK